MSNRKYPAARRNCFAIAVLIVLLYFIFSKSLAPERKAGLEQTPVVVLPAGPEAAVALIGKLKDNGIIPAALDRSEKLYQRYVQKRREFRRRNPDQEDPFTGSLPIWDQFLPTFNCPYSMERIGGLGDGGKWVCGFELYEKWEGKTFHPNPCVVYSFGVGRNSRFEAEFLDRTDCAVFAFDGTVSKMGRGVGANPKLRFEKVLLSNGEDSDTKAGLGLTLGEIMRKHNHTFIDFLKIDIEGAEFPAFSQILKEFEYLPFGQLNVELHLDVLGKRKLTEVYKMWEMLEQKGLRAFMNELNIVGFMNPRWWWIFKPASKLYFMEYSFVNVKNRMSEFNLGKN